MGSALIQHPLLRSFDAWFFGPGTPHRMALLRIAFGLLCLGTLVQLYPEARLHFSDEGWLPRDGASGLIGGGYWSLFNLSGSAAWARGVFVALIASAIAMTLGFATELSIFVLCMGFGSVTTRNVFITDATQGTILLFLMFLLFSRCGAVASVDAAIRGKSRPMESPIWPLRMLQLQLAVIYFAAGLSKLPHAQWWEGSTVAYLLLNPLYSKLDLSFLAGGPLLTLLSRAATWGVLAWELLFPALVSFRRTRLVAIAFGLLFHGIIAVLLKISWFGEVMIAAYLVFLPEDSARALLGKLKVAR